MLYDTNSRVNRETFVFPLISRICKGYQPRSGERSCFFIKVRRMIWPSVGLYPNNCRQENLMLVVPFRAETFINYWRCPCGPKLNFPPFHKQINTPAWHSSTVHKAPSFATICLRLEALYPIIFFDKKIGIQKSNLALLGRRPWGILR